MTHLYPVATQSIKEDKTILAPDFNDYETQVPVWTKKKRIVNSQPTPLRKQRSPFKGKEALIHELRKTLLEIHGMDPNYSESDDDELCDAHPQWAENPTFSEPDGTVPCQTPLRVRQEK